MYKGVQYAKNSAIVFAPSLLRRAVVQNFRLLLFRYVHREAGSLCQASRGYE